MPLHLRLRHPVLLLLLTAGIACGDSPTEPTAEPYPWQLVSGSDVITFHWPPASLPVRIWVEDQYDLPARVQAGLVQWRAALTTTQFRATIVTDSATADIIIRADRLASPTFRGASHRLGGRVQSCEGASDIQVDDDLTELVLPVHAYVVPSLDPELPETDACLSRVTTHELGHLLGIYDHSPDAGDLMHSSPTVAAPSAADIATMREVYRSPASLVPVRGA